MLSLLFLHILRLLYYYYLFVIEFFINYNPQHLHIIKIDFIFIILIIINYIIKKSNECNI
jgi:hypothetical protein